MASASTAAAAIAKRVGATHAGRHMYPKARAGRCRSRRPCSGRATPRASAAGGWRRTARRREPPRGPTRRGRASRSSRTRAVRCALAPLDRGIDLEELDGIRSIVGEGVHADDDTRAGLHLALVPEGRSLDLRLDEALLDRRDRSAEVVDPRDQLACMLRELVGQRLDEVGAAEAGPRCRSSPPRRRGSAACAARSSRPAPSGARAPRRTSSCAATARPRRRRRAPGSRPARCCSPAAAPSGSSRPSVRGTEAPARVGLVAPKRSRMISAHRRRAARNFATSWKKWLCALKKKERRSPNASGDSPAATAASQ